MYRYTARLLPLLAFVALPACAQEEDALPRGVEQILPRGGIPAVFDPRFVPAAEAEIADDAWVLGVVVDGPASLGDLPVQDA